MKIDFIVYRNSKCPASVVMEGAACVLRVTVTGGRGAGGGGQGGATHTFLIS